LNDSVCVALVDQALLRFVHELDRVLDGEDVAILVFVQVVNHRCQRGRFSGTGRAGDQHQAARTHREIGEDPRRVQVFQAQDLGWNRAQHGRSAAPLVVGVDAEARQPRDFKGKVDLQHFLVLLALAVVHDVVHHAVHILVLERRQVDAAHVAVHADHWRQPGRQVQVGGLVLD
jgi:hypothetical protein